MFIRDGEKGGRGYGGWGGGGGEIIYLSLHCHHQHDLCIKVGTDESHFNVLIMVMGKVTRQVSTDHNFWRERRAEADSNRGPSAYQPNALPPGQTGSLHLDSNCNRVYCVSSGLWPFNLSLLLLLLKCCLVSSDVSWHIRDKLWPMPKYGSLNLYVHGNRKAR